MKDILFIKTSYLENSFNLKPENRHLLDLYRNIFAILVTIDNKFRREKLCHRCTPIFCNFVPIMVNSTRYLYFMYNLQLFNHNFFLTVHRVILKNNK